MSEENIITSIELTKENILSFRYYLGDELLVMFKKGGCFAFGLLEDQTTAGVIFCRENPWEKLVEVLQLYVDEEVRKRGGGSLLLSRAGTEAALRGNKKVILRYGGNEDDKLNAFLENAGFTIFTEGETTAILALEDTRAFPDELVLPEEAGMYEGDNSFALPILTSVADILAQREFEGRIVSGGDTQPCIQIIREGYDNPINITVEMISPESSEYSMTFSVKKTGMDEEDDQSVTAVNVLIDEDSGEQTYIMSVSFEGGIPEEEEFTDYLAQFIGETQGKA